MPIRVYYEVLNQKGTPALYSDNYAQRPSAGFQGRIFNSPDTGQIFYDTGTTWTLLADAGVGSGSLASVCANGNTTATGISITAGGLSTNDFTNTGFAASVGYVWFAGTGGQMTGTQSFFWDNNNKWLGLGTNTPTAPFDIHTTGNIGIQINNTTTADSKIAFLNADVGKWRIGNLYSGGANLFHIYNNAGATLAMQINSSNAALFYGSLSANNFISSNGGLSLIHNSVPTSTGYTGIGGLTAGLSIALASGFNQTLTFPTGVAYTYTFPSSTGTLALTSNLGGTTGYLPKYASGTSLGQSLIYDNGTNVGIGTTSPLLKLDVIGGIRVNEDGAGTKIIQIRSDFAGVDPAINVSTNNALLLQTNNTERMRITSGGNVGIGESSPSAKLHIVGIDATSSNNSINIVNSVGTQLFKVRNDGAFFTGTASSSPYNNTSGGSANLIVTAAGSLERATSSLKYKTDVRNYDKGLDIIKQMRPVYYKGINDGNKQFAGFIAEEVHDLGLTEFVEYANDETPDALAYSNITALLTKGIQQIDTRLTNVEEALLTLEQKLN